jgi:G protein-coupled receptor Mth (Methuselah protein)
MSRKKFTYIYILCLCIAMLFLVATALGFKVVEKRNIQKQTMLFYITSQILFYFFIMVIYMDHLWNILSPQWCTPVGVLAHFFGLSTFTWLSVINFDLWWTFRLFKKKLFLKDYKYYFI